MKAGKTSHINHKTVFLMTKHFIMHNKNYLEVWLYVNAYAVYINKKKGRSENIMANQIRITPDQMRERANQYRAEADTVNGAIGKMDSLLQQLQSEWEGSASESYAARYQELKPGFMKAEELIREIATSLDSTAKIVEETDTNIANQFRG